jgi:hypothetical protein
MRKPIDETVVEMVELLDENQREMFEERAAVREHDGHFARAHAEALALLDVLDKYPEALTDLVVFQVDDRFFVANSTELALEHAAKIGGNVKAQRSVSFVVEEELGGLAELIVAA